MRGQFVRLSRPRGGTVEALGMEMINNATLVRGNKKGSAAIIPSTM
jgi:hypothetical protein